MGREVKRVALDFEWPLNKPYEGFINPHYTAVRCEHCDATGYSPRAHHLYQMWYGYVPFDPEGDKDSPSFLYTDQVIQDRAAWNVKSSPEYYGTGATAVDREAMRLADLFNSSWSHHLDQQDVQALIDGGRLWDFTRTFVPGEGWKDNPDATVPTARQVNEWSLSGMGHDSINQWIATKAVCDREGVSATCSHCDGQGSVWPSEEDELRYDQWERSEPPAGEGYQIWETVSEGSPISPMFADPHELAEHMSHTRWGADSGTSAEQWFKFIVGPGWAPSMIMDSSGRIIDGVNTVD